MNTKLKKVAIWAISHPYSARPRWWVRTFVNPFLIKRAAGSKIRRSVRLDIFPFHKLSLGRRVIIENFSTINNGMGDVVIGENSRIGLCNTLIGPISIGRDVHIAQNVVLSGLNHRFEDPHRTIHSQGVVVKKITIQDDVWIGANATIVAGVTIGRHSVVAAGSVVTHSVLPFSLVGGIPAKVIRSIDQ